MASPISPAVRIILTHVSNGDNFSHRLILDSSRIPSCRRRITWTRRNKIAMDMAAEEAGGTIEAWLRKHRRLFIGATRHPFILSIRDGQVNLSAFKRWLGQDYIFVRRFIPFVAGVLLKASKESDDQSDVDVILGGMAALNDEIAWFKDEASKWHRLSSHCPNLRLSYLRRLRCPNPHKFFNCFIIVSLISHCPNLRSSYLLRLKCPNPHKFFNCFIIGSTSGYQRFLFGLINREQFIPSSRLNTA